MARSSNVKYGCISIAIGKGSGNVALFKVRGQCRVLVEFTRKLIIISY